MSSGTGPSGGDTLPVGAMRRAVALAARGLGGTSPNPVVGCVVLDRDGQVAGEGFHAYAGGPHAEVVALREAGGRARGGTAVVTLEPCAHTGRTGPCTQALIDAGIARVVYAVADPNPAAAGGAAVLRAAGIDVTGGVLADEAAAVNEAWLTAARLGRPHVTWKFAATLDGRSAAADGTSRWITSAEARADVHALRARSDAVVVGSGTLIADDPHLGVRGEAAGGSRPPLRVVVDTAARTRPGARVLDDSAPTLVAVAPDAAAGHLDGTGAEVVRVPRDTTGLDLNALLKELYARDVRAVLLEGGPTLAGAFAAAGLIDTVVAYLAPALLGAGSAALGPAGIGTIADILRLRIDDVTRIGPDLRIVARPAAPENVPDTAPENVPDTAPENVPDTAPDDVPGGAPDTAPDTAAGPGAAPAAGRPAPNFAAHPAARNRKET